MVKLCKGITSRGEPCSLEVRNANGEYDESSDYCQFHRGGSSLTYHVNEKQLIAIEDAASDGVSVGDMAALMGVSTSTFYNIMRRDPRVAIAYRRGLAQTNREASSSLREKVLEGNLSATIFWLKSKAGWRDRDDHVSVIFEDEAQSKSDRSGSVALERFLDSLPLPMLRAFEDLMAKVDRGEEVELDPALATELKGYLESENPGGDNPGGGEDDES